MYNDTKIEDVIKYLYEQKQDKLAKAVLDIVREYERAKAAQPTVQYPPQPNIWYGDGVNPPYRITS